MSETPEEPREIEGTDDEREFFVVDPEDYQRTKKLEAIHKAKERVRKVREDDPMLAQQDEWEAYKAHLASTVADYGNELLPIIEDGLEKGILEEEDLNTKAGHLQEFVLHDGKIVDHEDESVEVPSQPTSMLFYRQLERIQRKLGLGLDIEENQGPAQI